MTKKSYSEKFLWSSIEFESWVKQQQKKFKNAGFKISTAGVTHKLAKEVLEPNQITLQFPKMEMKKRKKR